MKLVDMAASGDTAAEAALPTTKWDDATLVNQQYSRIIPLTTGMGALAGTLMGVMAGWSSYQVQFHIREKELRNGYPDWITSQGFETRRNDQFRVRGSALEQSKKPDVH